MPTRRLASITITALPHDRQRYPTTGDWMFLPLGDTHETLSVFVSLMPDDKFESLVGAHETIEALLCRAAGIDEEDVSNFDTLYEDARTLGHRTEARMRLKNAFGCTCEITDESEPGDDVHAPYYKQHQLATSVERMIAAEMGVSWMDYEQANLDLYNPPTVAPK